MSVSCSVGEDDGEQRTIWMGAIQPNWDETYLYSLFSATGEVVRVKLMRNASTGLPSGYAFIEFRTMEAARHVLEAYNGMNIPGTSLVFRLNWGTKNKMQNHGSSPQHSLFVGDLSPDVTDQLLLAAFQQHFSSCVDAKVIIDQNTGQSKGYGFVRFDNKEECDRAIETMNGVIVGSRRIRVDTATQRRNDSGTGSPLGAHPAQGIPPMGYHMMYNYPGAQMHVPVPPQTLGSPMHMPDRHTLNVESPQDTNEATTTTVFIGNLDAAVDPTQISEHFADCGKIESIKIPPNRGCGFVKFSSREEAEKAIETKKGTTLGNARIRLDWGKFSMSNNKLPQSPQGGATPVAQMHAGMMYATMPGWQVPNMFYQQQAAAYYGQFYAPQQGYAGRPPAMGASYMNIDMYSQPQHAGPPLQQPQYPPQYGYPPQQQTAMRTHEEVKTDCAPTDEAVHFGKNSKAEVSENVNNGNTVSGGQDEETHDENSLATNNFRKPLNAQAANRAYVQKRHERDTNLFHTRSANLSIS
uniref:RRM domain-containing protein n=1 Tax=Mucochytrium quahogii TaxID=96639 RepID=A0A7S2SNF8_9STRA|mmetsp:Transcript_18489/g.30139  ORF Transcript_18489/g.30139 Transcript_18489/m.30139 type:complete len:524 (-) Transcript_18489:713-2284(-)|eukprot:CAMPEP_0203761868 /NCGR_PEP_ID=MMETSP0098-20131031/14866_1 /ASSEMBLY_ACC=CAM_ASM_000208 /TAXON_ID=96639 /ORGANISM=" , Strain NY0313808BC1" /LENGTH=523 /DNA_ID=CAMNT_0050656037 /DNA_START=389 /DNA_END=1960 /DNA_ORIENTATION=+